MILVIVIPGDGSIKDKKKTRKDWKNTGYYKRKIARKWFMRGMYITLIVVGPLTIRFEKYIKETIIKQLNKLLCLKDLGLCDWDIACLLW